MKYLKEAVLRSNAKWYLLASIISRLVYITIDGAIVIWLTEAINGNVNSASKVILGCCINILMSSVCAFLSVGIAHIFVYLSNVLTNKVLYSDYDFFIKNSPDSVLTTHSNITPMSKIIKRIESVISSIGLIIVNIVGIYVLNPPVLLSIIPIFIISAVCMSIGIKSWVKCDKKFDSIKRSRNKELYDVINGFAEIRSFNNTETKHFNSIIDKNSSSIKVLLKRSLYGLGINGSIEGSSNIATIVLMFYSMLCVADGKITTAVAINTVMYGWRFVSPIHNIVDTLSDLSESLALLKPWNDMMSYTNTVPKGTEDLITFSESISFNDVYFRYENDTQVLNGVTFDIKKGEHIGICGTSGGGKSTLLKLIPKFYSVDKGEILIDGNNINCIKTDSLRSHIGVVHQDPYIFDGTIMDNLKYANPNADYFEVIDACKKASIYDFVINLSGKFDTYVGPKGMKLSGGQKQRIALARIFLQNPDIIILDEATSALDTETERFIQKSLNTIFKDKTMIIVAHRLSTIINSDRIMVIDSGNIVEEGTHRELMDMGGIYYNMYNADKEE